MTNIKLSAEERKVSGRKVKRLRKEGILPANVYGKDVKSLAVQVALLDFEKVFRDAGETNIVDLTVGKKVVPVLVHNVQLDSVTDVPIHVDFLQINLKEKVTAQVPIELINESPAEKQGLGTAVQYIDEVEVEALPAELPEKFEIDIAGLTKIDQAILIKDLTDEKGVEIKADPEQMIVKIEALREEEELPAPTVEGTEETAEETKGDADEAPKDTENAPEGEEKKE